MLLLIWLLEIYFFISHHIGAQEKWYTKYPLHLFSVQIRKKKREATDLNAQDVI